MRECRVSSVAKVNLKLLAESSSLAKQTKSIPAYKIKYYLTGDSILILEITSSNIFSAENPFYTYMGNKIVNNLYPIGCGI